MVGWGLAGLVPLSCFLHVVSGFLHVVCLCGLVWASKQHGGPSVERTTEVRFPGNKVKAAWPFTTLFQKSSLHFTVYK